MACLNTNHTTLLSKWLNLKELLMNHSRDHNILNLHDTNDIKSALEFKIDTILDIFTPYNNLNNDQSTRRIPDFRPSSLIGSPLSTKTINSAKV